LYGVINLGIHISMFLVSLNMSRRDFLESDQEPEPEPESDLELELEPEVSDSEYSDPDDPSYVPRSDFNMNLRKRKKI